MTKKDYIRAVKQIKLRGNEPMVPEMIDFLVEFFSADNARFDPFKFRAECLKPLKK